MIKKKNRLNVFEPNYFWLNLTPCWSVLYFWKINLEKSSLTNWTVNFKLDFYCLCSLQKSTLKLIFQVKNPVRRTRFFKNQIQMVRANVALFLTQNESLHLLLWAVLSALRNSCLTFECGRKADGIPRKSPCSKRYRTFHPRNFQPQASTSPFSTNNFWLKLKVEKSGVEMACNP